MRHRLGNKSLSRPTAHRLLLLRNLVSSLLQHEQITTTVAKAKEAQKVAEKVIGWGKKGGRDNWVQANSFLLVSIALLQQLDCLADCWLRIEPHRNPSTTLYDLFREIRRSCWRLHETSSRRTSSRRLRCPRHTRTRRFTSRSQVRISRERRRKGISGQIERRCREGCVVEL